MLDAFLSDHLLGVSRTYAIVVPMLPPPLDESVGLAYLLMRIVDTVEDAPELDPPRRVALLHQIEAALAGDTPATQRLAVPLGDRPAEQQLMQAAPEVLRRLFAQPPAYRDPIFACARHMSAGVQKLLARSAARGRPYPAIENLTELREYCYYVAGVVGEMLCELFAHWLDVGWKPPTNGVGSASPTSPNPQAAAALRARRHQAVELGTGLQLVNILKDCFRDAEHGRRYLPAIGQSGASAGEIAAAGVAEARRCLETGLEYLLAVPPAPPGLRRFCGLPLVWAALTLHEIERNPAGAKITRDAVGNSISEFEAHEGADAELRDWIEGLLRPTSPHPHP